jgi:ParB-like chromosome segregation protein Spo0J
MAQRKVDDNIVLQLLREGKNQREIADHFKVSPVAICKRLKKILPKPQSLEKLTDKEQNFVIAVAEGKSRTQAALDSFDVSSRDSAKALQNTLMKKDNVRIAIAELMDIFGLTRGYRINKLKTHIDHVDPGISLKGLDLSFKLDGSYSPEKHIVGIIDYRALIPAMDAADARDMAELARLRAKNAQLLGNEDE